MIWDMHGTIPPETQEANAMSEAPEHIWAVTEPDDVSAQILGEVYAQQVPDGMVGQPVKYVRADLYDAQAKVVEAAETEPVTILRVEIFSDGDGPSIFTFLRRSEARKFSKSLSQSQSGQVIDWIERDVSTAKSALAALQESSHG